MQHRKFCGVRVYRIFFLLGVWPTLLFGAAGDLYVGDLTSRAFSLTPTGGVTQLTNDFDPYGIAFNAQGDAFFGSSSGQKIVRRTIAGVETDFAAGLGDPLGLAFDASGNLYAADYSAGTIWKFTPDGTKTSFATGIANPDGVAFDPAGNLFVTGYTSGRLTKITPDGTKTTFAQSLVGPVGVVADAAGNIFVAERDGGRIVRFTPAGAKSTFSTALSGPYGLTIDAGGTLFASDQFSGTIYRMSALGARTRLASINGQAGFLAFEPATGVLRNVSTRLRVLTGDNVLIGGFIISGTEPKKIMIRALGPSLGNAGVPGVLQDPVLELHNNAGAIIATNDFWRATQETEIEASTLAPTDDREAAIIMTLAPGPYTGIARGNLETTGVGSVEVYELAQGTNARLGNISTRGFVDTGDNVMIAGFINGTGNGVEVLVRALGPSLAGAGITNPLPDPMLSLIDGNGQMVGSNDNWKDAQSIAIQASTLAPTNDAEAALIATLAPGPYTAIVSGRNGGTGVGSVEVYSLR